MENKHSSLPQTLFRFIWFFLYRYKKVVYTFVFLTFTAGFWGPFNNILIKKLIDLLSHSHPHDTNLSLLAFLIIMNFIVFDNITWRCAGYIQYKYLGKIKNEIIHEVSKDVLDHSHQFFQEHLSGRIANQITTLANNIEMILHNVAPDFIRGISLIIMSLVACFTVNPIFCIITAVWFLAFSSISFFMSKKLISLSDTQAKSESLLSGQLVDVILNNNNVRIFSSKTFELNRLNEFLNNLVHSFRKKEGFILLLLSLQGIMIAGLIASSTYLLLYLYKMGQVGIGDFALILGLSIHLGHTMWFTMWQVDSFNQAYGKCNQSLSALMRPLDITDKANAVALKCPHGEIQFRNVFFQYKGAPPLFQNTCINIKPGQKTGLVGYSGGGKSSFVNLILRLYDVENGAVLIDNQNIKDITQESLRNNIAIIPQDPSLFHRSLMDNIRYGRCEATNEEVIRAAKQAHAHDFIVKLTDGYNSLVGERGVKLSGGQRQRIAIARAVLKNAPILILDEATSQLDSVTEALIQDSLKELMHNKTTIVIAHRLSTLLHMDRILVFDKGCIEEDGSHEDLLQRSKLYKKLWDAQIGGFLGDGKKIKDKE